MDSQSFSAAASDRLIYISALQSTFYTIVGKMFLLSLGKAFS